MNATKNQCSSCGKSILWLRHERTQKPAPIDSIASLDGNILVDEETETYRIIPPEARPQFIGRLRKNHFVTCPFADQHAKSR